MTRTIHSEKQLHDLLKNQKHFIERLPSVANIDVSGSTDIHRDKIHFGAAERNYLR